MTTTKTLLQLNAIFKRLGTWEAVSIQLGIPSRTVRKWFTGESQPSAASQEAVQVVYCEVTQ